MGCMTALYSGLVAVFVLAIFSLILWGAKLCFFIVCFFFFSFSANGKCVTASN